MSTSSTSFVVCALILVGSLSYALFKRHADPMPPRDDRDLVPAASAPVVQPAAVVATESPLVRELASDTVSPSCRIAELETEIARLRGEVARLQAESAAVRFASALSQAAPEGHVASVGEVMRLMDSSDLTKDAELRALFVAQVRPEVAVDLLQAEPRFRATLHAAYSKGTPEWRQFEWPAHRDGLLNDFLRRLAEAGLSGRAVELYRASIADYL